MRYPAGDVAGQWPGCGGGEKGYPQMAQMAQMMDGNGGWRSAYPPYAVTQGVTFMMRRDDGAQTKKIYPLMTQE